MSRALIVPKLLHVRIYLLGIRTLSYNIDPKIMLLKWPIKEIKIMEKKILMEKLKSSCMENNASLNTLVYGFEFMFRASS